MTPEEFVFEPVEDEVQHRSGCPLLEVDQENMEDSYKAYIETNDPHARESQDDVGTEEWNGNDGMSMGPEYAPSTSHDMHMYSHDQFGNLAMPPNVGLATGIDPKNGGESSSPSIWPLCNPRWHNPHEARANCEMAGFAPEIPVSNGGDIDMEAVTYDPDVEPQNQFDSTLHPNFVIYPLEQQKYVNKSKDKEAFNPMPPICFYSNDVGDGVRLNELGALRNGDNPAFEKTAEIKTKVSLRFMLPGIPDLVGSTKQIRVRSGSENDGPPINLTKMAQLVKDKLEECLGGRTLKDSLGNVLDDIVLFRLEHVAHGSLKAILGSLRIN